MQPFSLDSSENIIDKTKNLKTVDIYILSHNRPNFIAEAIDSVKKQTLQEYNLYISDNSTTDDVERIIRQQYGDVIYIRRSNSLSALAHFKTIIEESTAEFLVMFHDDDVMMPRYLETLLGIITSDNDIAAVGCNGRILQNSRLTKTILLQKTDGIKIINSGGELFLQYCSPIDHVAPFPGYMYRSSKIKGLYLNSEYGGKHSDVSFLMQVAQRGKIIWSYAPLIQYRIHGSNDSSTIHIKQQASLLGFVYQNTKIQKKDHAIKIYKLKYLLHWWRCNKNSKNKVFAKRIILKAITLRLISAYLCRPHILASKISQLARKFYNQPR
ncbi:glycosyltransferase family 2 protein [Chromobacterium sp. S0633]|uniref:glycosyltransferase n=1 Tax=Chromobacterium sp. S0633 TaxID=2957805 RepID=UPI00209CE75A|nr:glycosyltransferase family 2 protein [Chromobacterium sp. S0633]MCP1289068.1 glycosyltransferase family 2 protein [Chromobacterium sp. S0633]